MSDPIISVRDLRKTYHVGDVDVHALRGVNLDVQPRGISCHRRTLRLRQIDAVQRHRRI